MINVHLLQFRRYLLAKAFLAFSLCVHVPGMRTTILLDQGPTFLTSFDFNYIFNRMGKTRDLFKKIRYTKGIFHAKMGTLKDRNGMDLTEAEDIKKRQQEYTEEPYKKELYDPDNHNGVITHLEPDILGCKVK